MRTRSLAVFLSILLVASGCSDTEKLVGTNELSRNVTLGDELPDLIVLELTVDSYTANSISYSYTIQNIGNAPANLDGPTGSDLDNVSVQAVLSADTVFNNEGDVAAGGTILGTSPLGFLDPGETFSGSFGATVDVDPCQWPYLVLMVDWGMVVYEGEEGENNNTLATLIDACVEIDIKPGSDPNSINPESNGVIPVAILGSMNFDVSTVDDATLRFGPSAAMIAHASAHYDDVNSDGFTDLVAHFRTAETGIMSGDTEACLTGETFDTSAFDACDAIRTVPPDNGPKLPASQK